MAQISIQLVPSTMKAPELTAARNNTSLSNWIKDRIRIGLKEEWTEYYFSIFCSLDEDDLTKPPEVPFEYEVYNKRVVKKGKRKATGGYENDSLYCVKKWGYYFLGIRFKNNIQRTREN